ncbi:response regulator transcription factor [Pedobacter cryoconitis]|uniref:Two-component system phosphate regulon response regulator PhoB/two-component system alkaline phosphatase synthesis response regulator PhoP n=1 Tax=Pedobacter cryoconitis TaxID=188932 RepID=A0A327T2T5_9SPHI|nr:response regulator [Pedobacter cryoconitis]RAJ35491.1 two-component system phosphate regulon response regulator PhoB/two-component system alkaline phosphatase synthesis response regulator PhoP [Pedobacter cryoconitis]
MNKKILVLEKNRDILELINIVLTEEGYDVDLLSSEKEIFDHIRDFQPDIILLDVISPTEEGTALCKTIKAAEASSHIPVIVLSTHPKSEVVKEICADEVVAKPFDISFLLSTIEHYLISA